MHSKSSKLGVVDEADERNIRPRGDTLVQFSLLSYRMTGIVKLCAVYICSAANVQQIHLPGEGWKDQPLATLNLLKLKLTCRRIFRLSLRDHRRRGRGPGRCCR